MIMLHSAMFATTQAQPVHGVDELLTRAYLDQLQQAIQLKGANTQSFRFVALYENGLSQDEDDILCHCSEFVVMLVFELSNKSIGYLKYADYLIFSTQQQAQLYRDVYIDTTAHDIWPSSVPLVSIPTQQNGLNLAIICPTSESLGTYQSRAARLKKLLRTYKNVDLKNILLFSRCDKTVSTVQAHDIADTLQISSHEITVSTQSSSPAHLGKNYTTVVFQPEEISPYTDPNLRQLIGTNQFRTVDFCLRSPLYQDSLKRIGDNALIVPQETVQNIIATQKASFGKKMYPLTDTIDSLNIVMGTPLENAFIVSILYRNAGVKLQRAIQSVISSRGNYDVGIALIDDCSTDGSLSSALELIEKNNIPCVVVANKERKYAANNYYNVIHNLTTNDQSILIDLDGDDYLNPEEDVFAVLSRHYGFEHVQKIIASYSLLTDIAGESESSSEFLQLMQYFSETQDQNINNPWNLTVCASWKHLRSTRLALLRKVEIDYFMERDKSKWLRMEHDISVHSRAIELASKQVRTIPNRLYVYDLTGENHDNHNQASTRNSYIYKLFHAYRFDIPNFAPNLEQSFSNMSELEIDLI